MSTKPIPREQILGYECRHVVHCPTPKGLEKDLHLIKTITHSKDGQKVPEVKLWWDFKQPFYVTKKGYQNHEQKKEWESIDKVNEFKATRTRWGPAIANALGFHGFRGDLRPMFRSPYLYGADILSTAAIKRTYQDKYPDLQTQYTVAAFDTEKDVVDGTDEITIATISFGDRVFTAAQKSYVKGIAFPERNAHDAMERYLGEYVSKRNIKWEFMVVDSEIDVVKECFKKAHEWRPDFVAIWNMDFDVTHILKACTRAGVDPADIFSDPLVPPPYRFCRYKQGSMQKITSAGKITPVKPADRWHTLFAPASFYVIDAMCVYRKLRIADGEERSYKLDAILNKILGIRKLNFKEADGYVDLEWHKFMQRNYRINYIIYNVFDCISMEELDDKLTDLSISLPGFAGSSDFCNFNSQPRRAVDELHYFLKKRGLVIGTTSDELRTKYDSMTISPKDWIVTLPAHLVADNGLRVIKEFPHLRTNIRGHVNDLDVTGSYPNGGACYNMSRATTKWELCQIQGVDEATRRMQGVNLTGGHTNAVEICTSILGLPTLHQVVMAYDEEHEVTRAKIAA